MKKRTFATPVAPPSSDAADTDPAAFAKLAAWADDVIEPMPAIITKRGRPARGERRVRLVQHSVKTSPDEWKHLTAAAKARGLSSNAMLRSLLAKLPV